MGNKALETDKYNLIITRNKICYSGYEYIEDDYTIPSNIEIVDNSELEYYENIFSIKLPLGEKKKIISEINKGKRVIASNDIKIIL